MFGYCVCFKGSCRVSIVGTWEMKGLVIFSGSERPPKDDSAEWKRSSSRGSTTQMVVELR